MSGLYTELAKKRAAQSKELVANSSPLPSPEKPVSKVPQGKKEATASLRTRKRAKLSLSPFLPDAELVEKYTTHVEPSLVKKVQIEAIEREINDYDVVRIALKEYF